MGGKEDKFDKFDEMGQLLGGYDVDIARDTTLQHARENLLKQGDWLYGLPLVWEIGDAYFDEDADCYKVFVMCYPKGRQVKSKAQWEYHVDALGNLFPGTPTLRNKGEWENSKKWRSTLLAMLGVAMVVAIAVIATIYVLSNSSEDDARMATPGPEADTLPPMSSTEVNIGHGRPEITAITLNYLTPPEQVPTRVLLEASVTSYNPIVLWEWDFGDGTAKSGKDIPRVFHDYTVEGNYTVTVTVYDSNQLMATFSQDVIPSEEN